MKTIGAKKISEGAYFIVDTVSYHNQITPFDLVLATQTILSTSSSQDNEEIVAPEPPSEMESE